MTTTHPLLRGKRAALLAVLKANHGQIVRYATLKDRTAIKSQPSLNGHIRQLRKDLVTVGSCDEVVTIIKVGYKLQRIDSPA